MLISNSLGNLSGVANVDSGLGKIGAEVVKDIPQDVAVKIYEAESKRFMARMITEPNLGQAINAMGGVEVDLLRPSTLEQFSSAYRSMPNTQRLSEVWVDHPPSYQLAANQSLYADKVAKTLDRYAAVVGHESMLRGGTDVLASFTDYFPGYDGADRQTAQAKASSRYNPSPSKATLGKSNLRASSVRARSFYRLRGFSRVGGVLIGRPPEEHDSTIPIKKIHWEYVGDDQLKLSAVSGNTVTDLGTFNSELVGLALAYAADGRPTTVTMVTASPLTELKILIHPTLEDTNIGCLATRLDQLVDETTSGQDPLKRLLQNTLRTVELQHAFYKFSWAVRAKYLSQGDSNYSAILLKRLGLEEMIAGQVERNLLSNSGYAKQALGSSTDGREFMRVKSAFYDTNLLASMEACVESANLEQYVSCIVTQSEPIALSYDKRLRWAAPPPNYQPWSGVREAGYSLRETFDFVQWAPKVGQFPLEFTYQLAFTTPPILVDSQEPWYAADNADINRYSDINPWQFSSFKKQINQAILTKYYEDREYRRILSTMSQFVILQRLFRLALDGKFGEEFQVENLATLSQQVSSKINPSVTRRWLSRAGQIENLFVNRVTEFMKDVPNKVKTNKVLTSCYNLIQSKGNFLGVAALSPGKWNQHCRFKESYAGKDLAQFSHQVSLIRQLRFDIGVVAEDIEWKGIMSCSNTYQ